MKALVTGATGFLGSHLMEALEFDPTVESVHGVGRNVTVDQMFDKHMIKADLSDPKMVKWLMGELKPDTIFHCAANPLIKPNADDPFEISKSNFLITHHLLEYAPKESKFIFVSSAAVYGSSLFDDFTEDSQVRPESVYGACKLASEALVTAYHMQGRISGRIVRPVAIVGKNSSHGILYDFIRKLQSDEPSLKVLGREPGSCKPFVHVADVVDLLLIAAKEGQFVTLNASRPRPMDVGEIAATVMEALSIFKPIEWGGQTWAGDSAYLDVNSHRAVSDYGWCPRYSTSKDSILQAVKESVGCTLPSIA